MAFKDEREAIIGVLEFTGKLLERLISRLNSEDRTWFEDAWKNETKPQLEDALNTLRGLPREEDIRRRAYEVYEVRGRGEGRGEQDWSLAEAELSDDLKSENGPLHSFMRRVGLVGKSLKLKLHYLTQQATGGSRSKLLDLLNKFLGSLAGGLPGVEPIKELKEWLEGLLENDTEPDETVRTVYKEFGNDPFRLNTL